MSTEDDMKKAHEVAARAIHEAYCGAGSWKSAKTTERSHARQAVRLALAAFRRHGLEIGAKTPVVARSAPIPPARPLPRRL
jgi:hypothetical protein